jgi:hypothetical protein
MNTNILHLIENQATEISTKNYILYTKRLMTSELSGVHGKSFLGSRTRSNKSESSVMEDLNWFRQLSVW